MICVLYKCCADDVLLNPLATHPVVACLDRLPTEILGPETTSKLYNQKPEPLNPKAS